LNKCTSECFAGSYPSYDGEYVTMKACIVGYYDNCVDSWNVTVTRCRGFNLVYLEPVPYCGRFCMGL